MINIATEHLVSLSQASRLLPGRPAVSTLWRWSRGIRGVQLSTTLIGAKRYTSTEALQRFCDQLTASS
ncbi:MAG: DUF1580 domain-containing protein, partial [Pirellulales bacterium]|nr:DUF1580 domain-containing protein [Pirellulales bacterium]